MEPTYDVLVIGAGFSGIGAAIKLDEAGFGNFLVLEGSDGIGGAWHANTYPGVAVDIPSFSYSFSFEKNPEWSRIYAPGAELKGYAEHCVDKFGIRNRIKCNTKIVGASFDEQDHIWTLESQTGETFTGRYVVSAAGVLTQPKKPDIEGLDDFTGTVVHTARWDHSLDLTGKRVAVIGTGASAVQLVPSIAPDVEHLTVFQRTPIWVLPKIDAPLAKPVQQVLKRVPLAQQPARLLSHAFVETTFVLAAHFHGSFPLLVRSGERAGRRQLAKQVHDPVVREQLTPKYGLGCKRPSISNTYLPAFNRENVTLQTNPIARITPTGITTADGTEHEIDVLVLATGFKVFEHGNMPPFEIRGVGGQDLEKYFDANRYQAYQGVSVPGFPNMFSILGPYGYNGTSYFQLIENQSRHIVRALSAARSRNSTLIEVKPDANDRYFALMLKRRPRQVFFTNNCSGANSYYFDHNGDVPLRAATSFEAYWQSGHYDVNDYRFERAV
jgi:cation diffusion facilitator CzcD-associated flavoprotein CzcO